MLHIFWQQQQRASSLDGFWRLLLLRLLALGLHRPLCVSQRNQRSWRRYHRDSTCSCERHSECFQSSWRPRLIRVATPKTSSKKYIYLWQDWPSTTTHYRSSQVICTCRFGYADIISTSALHHQRRLLLQIDTYIYYSDREREKVTSHERFLCQERYWGERFHRDTSCMNIRNNMSLAASSFSYRRLWYCLLYKWSPAQSLEGSPPTHKTMTNITTTSPTATTLDIGHVGEAAVIEERAS